MAIVTTDDKHYKDIANTIRENDYWGDLTDDDGNSLAFKPEEMATNVQQVIVGSYDYAWSDGWNDGYDQATEVLSKELETYYTNKAYDGFWNLLQEDGKRVDYSYAFTRLDFNRDNFKPKYSFKPTNAQDMFNNCPSPRDAKAIRNFIIGKQVVMKDLEEELGITFDFSNCTNFTRVFTGCLFSELNVIDMRKVSSRGNTALAFYGGYIGGDLRAEVALRKIEKIIVNETTPIDTGAFNYQLLLNHIRFEGVIGTDLSFKDCPLDKDSITNIINHLSDNTTGKTLTLNFEAVDKAYNPEGRWDWTEDDYTPIEWLDLIATKPNWNIVFA